MTKLVKICGLKTQEAADKAIYSKADLLGVILVPGRARSIDHEVGKTISKRVKLERSKSKFQTSKELMEHAQELKLKDHNEYFIKIRDLIIENGPFLVGVFRNQSIEDVFKIAQELDVDFIQLHGNEILEDYHKYNQDKFNGKFGIIKRYVIPKDIELMSQTFSNMNNGLALALLDSELGGEGKTIDWSYLNKMDGQYILAGGLNPDNLADTNQYANIIGFDVSGGVEKENGEKDLNLIDRFITNGKNL